MTDAACTYCLELVRQADKDRFLATLFAPEAVQPRLMALYAFNIEIARIREMVSDPKLGEIRLAWWRDSIVGLHDGKPAEHPVLEALAPAIEASLLPLQPFLGMIESRQFDLYDDPMPSMGDLEGYLGETSSALVQLAAMILAGPQARTLAETAGLAGVAYGLTGLLRSLPVQRARGQCYVPKDLLARYGLTPAHWLAGREEEKSAKLISDLCDHAALRLREARAAPRVGLGAALPAFLPASLTDLYLKRIRKLGTGALATEANVSQLRRQVTLYLNAKRNIF
ncbi:MAG: phytoene/squalene synthase family protein [Rhizobiales bacterium]|nr:phytoene/squalene synthase family protein [Hyphomicrobiales bacterium]